MHSIMVIGGGLVLLVLFCLIGRTRNGREGIASAALWFLPVWLAASLYNMSVGVRVAGLTVIQEIPFLIIVFGLPALMALIVNRRFRS